MLWFLLSLILLLFLLLWLPVQLEIDTENDLYRARWKGILGFRGVPGEEKWRWFFQLSFWEKELAPGKKAPRQKKKTAKKGKPPFTPRQGLQLFKNIMRAIDVRRFRLDWDTGDFVRNAWFYPVFHSMSGGKRRLSINFYGRQELSILLQTRLYRLAGAFLRVFVHPKIFKS